MVPRFLACFLLIPLLTLMADFMGVIGGAVVSTQLHARSTLTTTGITPGSTSAELDLLAGVFKSFFFGAAIALISCHRGFHSKAGAEGVGKAATEAFVFSFIAILFIDFVIGILWNAAYYASSGLGTTRACCYERATATGPTRILRPNRPRPPVGVELVEGVTMRFRQQTVLREINADDRPEGADRLHHRRERLRQDGHAQADDRPA